jgi:hypothetical protein
MQMSFEKNDVRFFFADAPSFCKPVAQDDVRFFFASMLRLSRRPDDIKFSFYFFVGIVQPTGWQGSTSATRKRKENKISDGDNREQQQSCSLFLS